MKELTRAQIETYAERKLKGESYSSIKKELADSGLSEEEVRKTLKEIDSLVLSRELGKKDQGKARQVYIAGLMIATTGLILTIAAKKGWVPHGDSYWWIYGIFFLGILIMFYARVRQRRVTGKYNMSDDRKKRQ